MSTLPRSTFLARLCRRPFPVLLGLAVGFLGCCVAGRVAARQQPFKNFVRFHQGLSPDSHYYPTYSHTLNLARQHVRPGKVLVVVGGNSVLNGVGQREQFVWSRFLQEELGDGFVVLNLAMRGQWPNEFGGLIAERLAADGVPVIYVTLGGEHTGWDCDWDGGVYPYLFWDGWGKGLIPSDPRRDRWLEAGVYPRYERKVGDPATKRLLADRKEKALEMRRGGLVDGVTYSQDLWTYVANRYRGSVWTLVKYPKFWRPHRQMADNDPGAAIPWETYNNPSWDAVVLPILRGAFQSGSSQKLLRGEGYEEIGEQYKAYLPDALQDRTLYVLRLEGAYYRARLAPDERARYEEVYRRLRVAVRQAGLNIEVVGENYVDQDYYDRSHISEQGGRKLAADLAPAVRAMSEKLYGAKSAAAGGKP